ncbi:glycine/D-amino acid oxidase-like deaminating enzyme [Aliiruegeria haliotis]|uniref:Glycine/D-amino acid oxidase-like deaminating enzyme n=1 Tax=Aliiruegeria haliotis TaxID=1280846 RepID=A0A2T0S035_9RHOB|nr:FAD-binding oxidoreductase [Aliiruegeria haliotis]PRY26775.1 glycine/D-amino acid oxidase-like deaminating enzyme [Aliiruegeria haliotis]
MKTFDVVIVGGGVMGMSTAYWLGRFDPSLSIAVVERDPSHTHSSTALSVASIRQQFSVPVNVRISRFGLEFIRGFAELTECVGSIDLGFRGNGYLFLAGSDDGAEVLRENCAMQRREGAGTELLHTEDLGRLFPWMNTADVSLASFGGNQEGWFDNMGLLSGLRALARVQGTTMITGEVVGLSGQGDRITSVTLGDGTELTCGAVVNAAGPRAPHLLRTLRHNLPVEHRKRTVFVVDAPGARHPDAPLIVDYQGYYARPEGDHWITAIVPDDDAAVAPDDFTPLHEDFEAEIWPRLWTRIPGFEAAKVLRCWVGHYAFNTFDQNAIVGRHPERRNLYLVNGFSGHGLQQAPAMGRGLAELILFGAYKSLDLSDLGFSRLLECRPLREREIV